MGGIERIFEDHHKAETWVKSSQMVKSKSHWPNLMKLKMFGGERHYLNQTFIIKTGEECQNTDLLEIELILSFLFILVVGL